MEILHVPFPAFHWFWNQYFIYVLSLTQHHSCSNCAALSLLDVAVLRNGVILSFARKHPFSKQFPKSFPLFLLILFQFPLTSNLVPLKVAEVWDMTQLYFLVDTSSTLPHTVSNFEQLFIHSHVLPCVTASIGKVKCCHLPCSFILY